MSSPPATEAAGALIFDLAGRVLLVKENYDRRRWSLPEGAVEPNETPEQAVVRETMEETGVTVRVEHLVGSYTLTDSVLTCHAFLCVALKGAPIVPETGEIAEIRWSHPDDVPLPTSNSVHYALPDAVRGISNVVRVDLPRVT